MALKDKTKIIFHNGLKTIGGTLIEIRHNDSRIFFDFGSVFDPSLENQPESFSKLIETNTINYVEGLYDPRLTFDSLNDSETTYSNEGVFISHAHLDHSKLINYLNPSIPLYSSNKTKKFIDLLNINNEFLYPYEKNQDTKSRFTREIIGLKPNDKVSIGEIEVKFISVDHDIIGSCGLLITTPTAKIAYSGDLRLHGYRKEDTINFCLESEDSDILIIEGVSVSSYEVGSVEEELKQTSEIDLVKDIIKILKENPNSQISFNYYIGNVERVYHIAKLAEPYRKVVLEEFHAFILKELTGLEVLYYSISDKNYGLDPNKQIHILDLLNDSNNFFWQLESGLLKYIDQIKPGGIYIHSNAEPFGPYDPNYEPFFELLNNKKIESKVLSCSGHGYTKDLMRIINWIRPKILCPIHSFHPERLYNLYGERILPEKGEMLELINKEENTNEF